MLTHVCYVAKVACMLACVLMLISKTFIEEQNTRKNCFLSHGGWVGGGAISISHIFTISHITLNELLLFLRCHTETSPHSVREQAGSIFSALCEQTRAWVSGGSFIIYR